MKFREQHEAFKRLAIQQGIYKLEQFNEAMPFGSTVPASRVDRWLRRLLDVPKEFSTQRRYVNRFKLGADPEFIFAQAGQRADARYFELAQGLAFGMDNNGRLVEIRPYPSRSALVVTASIMATLRWLAALYPKTLQYDWLAGAFLYGDGLGGHVHFGRKRPGRDMEIKALDAIDDELLALKAYPVAEVIRRRQGDERNQHYGMPGDYRKQMHGYEYRTFPSWLDSPELAFLTITLSKLVVHCPALGQGYAALTNPARHFQRVKNLLSYYKDVDDDARLALMLVNRKMPVHVGGDFKKRWGVGEAQVDSIKFIPSSIKPAPDEIVELFEYLQSKHPMLVTPPKATWTPKNPPEGYTMAIAYANTYGAKGLGELLWDVVSHDSLKLQFFNSRDGHKWYFSIPRSLANALPANWAKNTNHLISTHGDERYVYSNEKARDPKTFSECRRLLLETVLPFWRINEVKADSFQQWKKGLSVGPQDRFVSKVVYGDIGALPAKVWR